MAEKKPTLGQAIDQIIDALDPLEPAVRQTAIDAACSHLGIKLSNKGTYEPVSPSSAATSTTQTPHATPTPSAPKRKIAKLVDIRSLKEQKQPATVKEMACVVAYYLRELAPEEEKKFTISTQDLEKYFKQAKFRLPKAIDQVLRDAKSSGYFESAGRGEYKLNAVGYNLVVHSLPKSKSKGE